MPARKPTPIGHKFNRLTVIGDAPKRSNRMVFARCECGTVKAYVLSEVVHGLTRSCGCLISESAKARFTKHGHARPGSPTYRTWSSMVTRCTNPNCQAWPYYGGRGIALCARWLSFENFLADMGERPAGLTLDRKDNNKGYDPDNCRWATRKRQSNNQRDNTVLEHKGRRMTIAEWSEETGFPYNTIIARVHRLGWSIERALTETPRQNYPGRFSKETSDQ